MNLTELIRAVDERGAADAASTGQVASVRGALVAAAAQDPGSTAYQSRVQGAARLVSETWPFSSELGTLVLAFSEALQRHAR
ncbi:hypothetical protein [Curtobacterium sp. MCPF17_011]|uniref:hypothetical protein n=1 Tax=Curtobacterium sp. MCPF17_011 TaxID=2175652 RepID=UPI0011B597D6|nr:hypothetical protein [Curtobacterium sp. MCPF17_011]